VIRIVDTSGWSVSEAARAVETARVNLAAALRLDESMRDAPRDVRDEVLQVIQDARAQLAEAQTVLKAVRARQARAA
jgi:hypothetical protein